MYTDNVRPVPSLPLATPPTPFNFLYPPYHKKIVHVPQEIVQLVTPKLSQCALAHAGFGAVLGELAGAVCACGGDNGAGLGKGGTRDDGRVGVLRRGALVVGPIGFLHNEINNQMKKMKRTTGKIN